MGLNLTPSDINQTFIIEPLSLTGGSPTISACTSLYTNNIISCSGDTQIFLGTGVISFDGSIYTDQDLSANTINASTYFSGGTNLIDIINDISNQITGGTFNTSTDTLTLYKHNGQINVTGFTDFYTTGATLIGDTVYFDRNDLLSAYTVNLSSLNIDTYVTGVTFNDNQLIITRNDGVSVNTFINTFTGLTINGSISATTYYGDGSNLTGIPNTYVTGGTYSAGTAVFTNNTGGTFSVTGFSNNTATDFTGGTVTGATQFTNGLTANTFSASTYYGLPTDIRVTGGTYSNGTTTFTNNTGGTFSVAGYYTGYTAPIDVYVTGGTSSRNNNTTTITFTNNTGGTFNVTGLIDTFITGGTYSAGTAVFTNNSGNTFSVTGFSTGSTNTTVITQFTGGTITGATQFTNGLTANTISATTYLGLPLDVYSTGLTVNNTTYDLTITRNDGVVLTANLGILSSDVNITGGTYNNNTGVVTFYNNTGGTFNVSGFTTGMTDTRVTSFSYNNANKFSIGDSTGGTFTATINTVTGLTVNGSLSATTYLNLPTDIRVTGGTYSNGTTVFTNNTGGTFTIAGYSTGNTASNGLTKTGNNIKLGGTLTEQTLIDGYKPLQFGGNTPLEFFSVYAGTGDTTSILEVAPYGFTVGTQSLISGGTSISTSDTAISLSIYDSINNKYADISYYTQPQEISGNGISNYFIINDNLGSKGYVYAADYSANFTPESLITQRYVSGVTSGLTGIYTTGFTYNNANQFTLTNNTGGTLSASINTMTGLTINGSSIGAAKLEVTGGALQGIYVLSTGQIGINAVDNTGIANKAETATGTAYRGNITNLSGLALDLEYTPSATKLMTINGAGIVTIPKLSGLTNQMVVASPTGVLSVQPINDIYVTGGTYTAGTAVFTNNTGGTFSVTGFSTGTTSQSIYTTGFTYNNANQFTLTNNTGGTLSVIANTMTGLTINATGSTSGGYSLNVINSNLDNLFNIRNDGNIGIGETPQGRLSILTEDNLGTSYGFKIRQNVTGDDLFYIKGNGYSSFKERTILGIGVDAAAGTKVAIRGHSSAVGSDNIFIVYPYGASDIPFIVKENGNVGVGKNNQTPTARFHIQASGDTSTGYTFKADNLSSSPLLYIRNDGVESAYFHSTGKIYMGTSSIGKSSASNGVEISALGQAAWTFGFNNGELRANGVFDGGKSMDILSNSTSNFQRLQVSSGALYWDNGVIANDYKIRGLLNSDPSYTDILTVTQSGANAGDVGIGETTPTAKLHVKSTGDTSSSYALKIVNSGSTNLLSIKDDSEINMNGFTIRQLASATYFKTSGTNGYLWNSFNDGSNLMKLSNTGVLTINSTASLNSNVTLSSVSLGTDANTKEGISEFYKNTPNKTGFYFSAKEGTGYIQGFTTSTAQTVSLILGGFDGVGSQLETLNLNSNNNVGIGTSLPIAKLHVSGNTLINGNLTANTISATTYYNLPIDVYVTGGTYNAGTATFRNNTGGTFSVTGFNSGGGGGDTITGGTYNNSTGTLTLSTTGSSITVTGFTTGNTFTTAFTYSNNIATIKQNQGQPDLSIVINTMTGLTVNGSLSAITFTSSSINLTGSSSGQEFNLYRYSNDANAGGILSYKARGTSESPSAVLSGDTIAVMGGRAYNGTGFTTTSKANISFITSENWSSTNQGTYISFNSTASGSTTRSEVMKVDNTGLWVNGNKIVSGTSVSASTYYGDGSNLTGVAHAFTGTTTLNFGSPISGESSYTTTAVTNTNINQFSTVMVRFTPSVNHPSIEDSMIEEITVNQSDIVDGVGFNLNAYACEGTWGVYNIIYRIIN